MSKGTSMKDFLDQVWGLGIFYGFSLLILSFYFLLFALPLLILIPDFR